MTPISKEERGAGARLESIGSLALEWVTADTLAKALRKARAEIIARYGGCSRENQRGPDGYTLGPCYAESGPDFEGCVCCTESQPTHIAYHAAVAKASALRRKLKRAARILANEVSAAKPQQAPVSSPLPPPTPTQETAAQ